MQSGVMAQKVVLVTGCASGVGLNAVNLLAKDPDHRYIVIATVESMSLKHDLVAAVGDQIDSTVFIEELDLTNDEQIFSVVQAVIAKHGRIDILLNAESTIDAEYLDTMSRASIVQMFNINTIGVIRLTQAVLPGMKARKSGRIITVTSRSARTLPPLIEVYSSTRAAVTTFMEALTPVARQHNISICLIEPGRVNTAIQGVMVGGIEKVARDESVNDLDRSFARNFVAALESYQGMMSPEQAAADVVTILQADNPNLRNPLPAAEAGYVGAILADPTGEFGVACNLRAIKGDTK